MLTTITLGTVKVLLVTMLLSMMVLLRVVQKLGQFSHHYKITQYYLNQSSSPDFHRIITMVYGEFTTVGVNTFIVEPQLSE